MPLGLEIESAVVGTLEVAISFSGPSLTVRLSNLHIHAKPHTVTEESKWETAVEGSSTQCPPDGACGVPLNTLVL